MRLGGIAPYGVSTHLRFAVDADANGDAVTFTLDLAGTTTARTATTSAPIAITSDGKEVWSAFADAATIGVLDATRNVRAANVAVGSRPASVAITPDDALVLVASAGCNQLAVIDRASRATVQVFGEAEGIGREPRNVVLSPDGARAYVAGYVGDVVTVLERAGDRFRVVGHVDVGRRPTGMSVTPDGGTLFVAHFLPRGPLDANEGWVSIVATDTLTVAGETSLVDDSNTKPSACLTAIQGFDQYQPADLRVEGVPTELAGVFLDPSGATGWVPGLRPGGVPILEGNVAAIGFDFARIGANSPSDLFPLDARDPRHAAPMRLPSLPDITDRDESFLACRPAVEDVEAVTQFPVDRQPTQMQSPGTTLPSGVTPLSETGVSRFIAFTRGGRRVLLLSYNADEVMVLDGATHHPTSVHYLLLSGSNPIGMAVSPDGTRGYVAYENSTFVSVLDLSAYAGAQLPEPSLVPYKLVPGTPGQVAGIDTFEAVTRDLTGVPDQPAVKEVGQIAVVDVDPLPPKARRGRVLFTSSSPVKYPTLSKNREASCSACHPGGANDGTVWGTMEGERRTIGLFGGTAGRGWLHASATHQDSGEFATVIVTQRLGGTGLSDDDVSALSDYVAHGIPSLQRPAVDEALATKGQALFASRCTSCHAGAKHTSGKPDPSNALGGGGSDGPSLLDVGSATDWAGATLGVPFTNLFPPAPRQVLSALRGDRALGGDDVVQKTLQFTPRPDRPRGAFKAPALVNEWENALYFHDGRAASLEDAVRDIAPRVGPMPTDDEVNALVEYLKTL
jgi:DNA-binding beta-propeller fold protein YncE